MFSRNHYRADEVEPDLVIVLSDALQGDPLFLGSGDGSLPLSLGSIYPDPGINGGSISESVAPIPAAEVLGFIRTGEPAQASGGKKPSSRPFLRKADLLGSYPSCPDPIEGLVSSDTVRALGFLSQKEDATDGILSGRGLTSSGPKWVIHALTNASVSPVEKVPMKSPVALHVVPAATCFAGASDPHDSDLSRSEVSATTSDLQVKTAFSCGHEPEGDRPAVKVFDAADSGPKQRKRVLVQPICSVSSSVDAADAVPGDEVNADGISGAVYVVTNVCSSDAFASVDENQSTKAIHVSP